jgi:hypothetical protein
MRSQADELLSARPIAEFIFGDAGDAKSTDLPIGLPIFRMGAAS